MAEKPQENTLLDHIEALRTMLLHCLAATALLIVPAYFAAPYVIRAMVKISCPPELGGLHYFTPMEPFLIQIQTGLWIALAVAFPYNLRQFWIFLAPALYPKERTVVKLSVVASTVLFAAGAAFCIAVILPLVMKFSISFSSDALKPILGVNEFLSFAGWLVFAFGLMFQFPVIVVAAVRCGLCSTATLAHARPYVIVGILILAAILTPPDIISQILLALPTWLLFEIALVIARRIEPEKKREV